MSARTLTLVVNAFHGNALCCCSIRQPGSIISWLRKLVLFMRYTFIEPPRVKVSILWRLAMGLDGIGNPNTTDEDVS